MSYRCVAKLGSLGIIDCVRPVAIPHKWHLSKEGCLWRRSTIGPISGQIMQGGAVMIHPPKRKLDRIKRLLKRWDNE